MSVIYLDNNATTRVAPEVLEEMLPFYSEYYGNPSSMHTFGGQVEKYIAGAREKLAGLIGARNEEIVFTSCGTESDSTAIWAAVGANPDKKHIVTTRVEHPAVINLYEYLSRHGYRVTFVPVDRKGRLDLDFLYDSLTPDTALVSVMWANNETGNLFPVEEMSRHVKERGVVFHTDAVQAAGKIPINLEDSGVDMLSISGHKLHGPKGVGALYIRRGTKFLPFLMGGNQESGRRAGTENVPSIIGLGRACELAAEHLGKDYQKVGMLRDRLEVGLMGRVSHTLLNGDSEHRLPNTTNISFEFIEGESILLRMDALGICASSGSACTSGSPEPSHVLQAMGVPISAAHGSIRFSLSVNNTREEVDFVIEKLPDIVERLRAISPLWKEAVGKT